MLEAQNLVLGVVVVDRVDVPKVRSRHAEVVRAKLPNLVSGDAALDHGVLPGLVYGRMVPREGSTILLQDDGLARLLADLVVLNDPVAAPGILIAPRVRIQVEGPVVERADAQVGDKVDALPPRVRVRPVVAAEGRSRREPALVPERHQVARVEALDVLGHVRRPLGDDGRGAALAARLVAQLPREYGA